MKSIAILSLTIFILSAGVVKSQAPVLTASDVTTSLQAMINSNKDLITKQQATLDGLDTLDQTAQELKTFAKRN
jgi:hypothetical protein